MDEALLKDLLDKYLTGKLSDQERTELSRLLEQPDHYALTEQILTREFKEHRFDEGGHASAVRKIGQHVRSRIAKTSGTKTPGSQLISLRRWAAVAAALLLVASIYLLTGHRGSKLIRPGSSAIAGQIGPGGNKAILSLGDGSRIDVGAASKGEVATQGKTKIIKSGDGQLIYTAADAAGQETAMNTLITPRGGIFQVTLPDGTQVWLNAASSIRYPSAFTGPQREVSITGEAYFEVAKDKSRPFRVMVNNRHIEVLGTHFNVNAYENEVNMKTTLLEGSIELINGPYITLLKPGEQAQTGKDDKITVLQQQDLQQTMAWKNGFFNFTDADLPTIMRQLERWYDIDVRFDGPIPQRHFQGELPRNLNLDAILKVLKGVNIKYVIKGKSLIIES